MPRKSINDKIEERFRRIQKDRQERDRQRYDKDYRPEQDGFISDKK